MPEAGNDFDGLKSIGQIAITVKDLPGMTVFYRDVLGMPCLFEAPGMAFFDLSGVRLMLGTATRPELEHPASLLYYRVRDIEAAANALKSRGVSFENDPHPVHKTENQELWLAAFTDPEGNFLHLMCEKVIEAS